jgi:hypothetical protein
LLTEQTELAESTGDDVIGPVLVEVVIVLEIITTTDELVLWELERIGLDEGLCVLETTTSTEDDDELKVELELGVIELEELESGTLVDTELPGEMEDDEGTLELVVVCNVVLDTAVFDAAAERHEQTAPAELRAARAVTIPQAAIAQFKALATIFTEEAEVHYDEVRTPLASGIVVYNGTRA